MKRFMGKNFLLTTDTARALFHEVAESLPICDFHCHIPPKDIAENVPFRTLSQVWLGGDHYKWRAMRIAGVPEQLITGNASDEEKFMAWAETMPKLIGNPLYHWTHLELQQVFGVNEPLTPKTAHEIYTSCNAQLQTLPPQALIRQANVVALATTDDPIDTLEYHKQLRVSNESGAKILPAWRPDKALNLDQRSFLPWLSSLETSVGFEIDTFDLLAQALSKRMDFFHENGCRLSDHGLDTLPVGPVSEELATKALQARKLAHALPQHMVDAYRMAVLTFLSAEYSHRGWTMQLHIGAMRNVNPCMLQQLGVDTGFDAIGDASIARPLFSLLSAMQRRGPLPRTLLFSLNDKDNYTLAALAGGLQRDGIAGHVAPGPAWWYHDQLPGMVTHLKKLATCFPLSSFVGMTTDSRSLLSYPRHAYFRRILCNLLGEWVENGEYPDDEKALEGIIRAVCFDNAISMFKDVL